MDNFTIERSNDFDLSLIKEVFELDKLVYSQDMAGSMEGDIRRYQKASDAFILLKKENKIIAYFCFFPVKDEFFEKMLKDEVLYDNNIGPEDISMYRKGENHHIFIISMVIHPYYKGQGLFGKLIKRFKEEIMKHHENGHYIQDISGYAVSGGGEYILKSFGSKCIKEVEESGDFGKLYIASYKDFVEANNQ